MRKALFVVAMAALLVTAGCSGLTGDETTPTSTATSTPTATPEPTATPTPEPSYPDGASASGIDNANRLNVSTQDALEQSDSYRITYRISTVTDGETTSNGSIIIESSAAGEETRFISSDTNYTVWEDGEYFGLKSVTEGQTRFLYSQAGSLITAVLTKYDRLVIQQVTTVQMRAFDFEMTGTTQRDGTRMLVYESTGVNETYAQGDHGYTPTEGNLTAYVSEDGVVRELSGTVVADGGNSTTEFTYKLDGIDATETSAPEWYDGKLPQLEGGLQSEGSLLVLNHTGGSTIPAGSEMAVTMGATQGGLQADTAIEPGDTFYVYVTENASTGETQLELSVNERPDAADLAAVETPQAAFQLRLEDGQVSVRLTFRPERQ